MTPAAARRILAQWKREDQEAALRFDLRLLVLDREGFGHGWPELGEQPQPRESDAYRRN